MPHGSFGEWCDDLASRETWRAEAMKLAKLWPEIQARARGGGPRTRPRWLGRQGVNSLTDDIDARADIARFLELPVAATARIPAHYFLLPTAGPEGDSEFTQYRERLYAYELYHQLRRDWPGWLYSPGGEIDKAGHRFIRGGVLTNAKPDLVVHVPGTMKHNLAAIEIKALGQTPRTPTYAAIATDVKTLLALQTMTKGYSAVFLLVFGNDVSRLRGYGRRLRDIVSVDSVQLYHHRRAGEAAFAVDWH